jgi:hypothetical protein
MLGKAANGAPGPAKPAGGLALLLRSMGVEFDPAQIAQWIAWAQVQIPATLKGLAEGVQQMNAQLSQIQANQAEILRRLDALAAPRPAVEPAKAEPVQ